MKDPVVVGPTLFGFILVNMERLLGGEKIDVRFAVSERLETIGFKLEKAKEEISGKIQIKMSPSSFVISILVDPLYFTFDANTRKITKFEGRVPPKVKINDVWKDFDARTEYEFFRKSYL